MTQLTDTRRAGRGERQVRRAVANGLTHHWSRVLWWWACPRRLRFWFFVHADWEDSVGEWR